MRYDIVQIQNIQQGRYFKINKFDTNLSNMRQFIEELYDLSELFDEFVDEIITLNCTFTENSKKDYEKYTNINYNIEMQKIKNIDDAIYYIKKEYTKTTNKLMNNMYLVQFNLLFSTNKFIKLEPYDIGELKIYYLYNETLPNPYYYLNKTKIRNEIFERDNYECQICGATENLSMDHIIPKSKGGGDSKNNLQCLCMNCNRKKGATIPKEYLEIYPEDFDEEGNLKRDDKYSFIVKSIKKKYEYSID